MNRAEKVSGLEWLGVGVKLGVMSIVIGTSFMFIDAVGKVTQDYVDRSNAEYCKADGRDAGTATKQVGSECYYLVDGRWIDIVDLAANADAVKGMTPSFRAGLTDRAKAAIESRRPRNDLIPIAALGA